MCLRKGWERIRTNSCRSMRLFVNAPSLLIYYPPRAVWGVEEEGKEMERLEEGSRPPGEYEAKL